MRIDIARLNVALDRTFEAAVDVSLWPAILQDISDATGSSGANIIPTAARTPQLVLHTENLARVLEEYFDDGWHENEWRVRAMPSLRRHGTARDQHYSSRDDFLNQDYYRFQARYGFGRSCMVGFRSGDDLLSLTLHRRPDQDFFDDEETMVFQAMRDRLTASAAVMRSASEHRISGMSEAFEIANVAAVFFNRFGKVVAVNEAASGLLGSELQIAGGELRSRNRDETRRIRACMDAVLSDQWLAPRGGHGPVTIARHGQRPIVVRIQRLGGSLPDFFSHAVGVCLLEAPRTAALSEPQMLRQLFALTPAEAEIAALLGNGLTLRASAEARSISYETARTHLRAIFAKTETGRQSELVALIAGLRMAAL